MIVAVLITVIILTAAASHVHCQIKPPFKKKQKLPTPTAENVTRKELLGYNTCIHINIKL